MGSGVSVPALLLHPSPSSSRSVSFWQVHAARTYHAWFASIGVASRVPFMRRWDILTCREDATSDVERARHRTTPRPPQSAEGLSSDRVHPCPTIRRRKVERERDRNARGRRSPADGEGIRARVDGDRVSANGGREREPRRPCDETSLCAMDRDGETAPWPARGMLRRTVSSRRGRLWRFAPSVSRISLLPLTGAPGMSFSLARVNLFFNDR